MRLFIKPKTNREREVWDNGFSSGLFIGAIVCGIELVLLLTLYINYHS